MPVEISENKDSSDLQIIEKDILIKRLKNEIVPLRNELLNIIDNEKIDDFSTKLMEIAKEHHSGILTNYTQKIVKLSENFDIEELDKQLIYLTDLINELSRKV